MADSQGNDNTTCVVCFKNVVYYSIGECDHPVCFECSTRMRVLCLQNECPICRQDLAKVVFTDTVKPYKELRNKVFTDRLFERQFKIGFCSEEIKKSYEALLQNHCKICDNIPPFRTFAMLNDHMKRVHERYFCDLCVKHLRIFTSERRCYTRQELAHHRRKGDLDDTSHRGHPLCEFCEERFMDADELYRHLRKEHLYCHLCDVDGRNLYYASHSALAHHFRTEHYLCEEGECAGQHLTAVFRSEIDLKAHKATVHGRGMNRGAARQARTLELQFNITPHPTAVVQRVTRERAEQRSPSPPPPVAARIDPASDEQFPRLSANAPAPAPLLAAPSRAYKGTGGLARNDRNFPALDGAGPSRAPAPRPNAPVAATVLRNSKQPSVSIQVHSQPASASNFRLTQTSGNRITIPKKPLNDEDFPSLLGPRDDHPSLGAATLQPAKVTLINSDEMQSLKKQPSHQQKKAPLSTEAFPALSSSSAPTAPPQWITVSKSKDKGKQTRSQPEPNPPPREPTFNPVADFPTLPINTKSKKKSQAVPIQLTRPQPAPPAPQTNTQSHNEDTKNKNKKKKNANANANAQKEKENDTVVNGVNERNEYLVASINNNNSSGESDRKIKTITDKNNSNTTTRTGNGDFALKSKEYPPLNPKADNFVPPPPVQIRPAMNGSVPPGFKKRPPCDGMTFTNSAGQTFPAPVHQYMPPANFESRNRALVKKFAAALGTSDAVEDFKVASRAFRDSIIGAEEFYQHCKTALGSKFEELFPELVALLPDIAKQQELVVGKNISALDVCSTCGQVISIADTISHDTAHWPPLAPR
ncbi:E3 ubiquitin-protein ligase ZNF598 [Colias croceus]|uniref:E3 ubiquitin-protein ligase ZNF598 n=1 Tax=Colias crocea TaxID=72248 RepID=UPI001E27E23F|nr:E3 ubiquitin-protein ligase ZNF598 [Colias croceus]